MERREGRRKKWREKDWRGRKCLMRKKKRKRQIKQNVLFVTARKMGF